MEGLPHLFRVRAWTGIGFGARQLRSRISASLTPRSATAQQKERPHAGEAEPSSVRGRDGSMITDAAARNHRRRPHRANGQARTGFSSRARRPSRLGTAADEGADTEAAGAMARPLERSGANIPQTAPREMRRWLMAVDAACIRALHRNRRSGRTEGGGRSSGLRGKLRATGSTLAVLSHCAGACNENALFERSQKHRPC